MANEMLELVMEELPDAFLRHPGTAVDKIKAYREFSAQQTQELMDAYQALPDSLNRPLVERILGLLIRANSEAQVAVKLRNRLEEIKPGSSSDI